MDLRMYRQRCYVRYALRTVSAAEAQRKLRIRVCSLQHRTCDMFSSSSSSCAGAGHKLSTLLRMVLLRTVSAVAAAVVLPFYAATLCVIISSYTRAPRI